MRKGYAIYDKENDLYHMTLPEVKITPRNINLAQVVRNGTESFAKPIIKAAETAIDFSPLSPALAAGRVGAAVGKYQTDKNKYALGESMLGAAFEALPYANYSVFTTPIKRADNIIKKITKEKYGIDKISLATPHKGVIADIELSPAEKFFGKEWMRPEFISVVDSEQGKGLSKVLYDEGIKYAKSRGYSGILSGEVLLQPAKTMRTQKSFLGPESKHFISEYDYPIKGMEAPLDPNLSQQIIDKYNQRNVYESTMGEEFLKSGKELLKKLIPKNKPKVAPSQIRSHNDVINFLRQ